MNFGTLLPRIVTGLAVLALLGLALYFGHTWMIALAFVCAVLGLWEFYSLFWPGRTHLADKLTGMGLAVIVFAGSWLQHAALWGGAIDSLIAATAVCFLIVAIVFLIRYGTGRGAARLDDAALTLFGVLYVPIPIALALLLPRAQVLLLLAVVASADTCAYFAGNLWGKRRIWPRISPKKSVEGCLGGVIGSVLACLGFGLYHGAMNGGSAYGFIVSNVCLGIFLAVFAILGDLFESALKRAYDVKDSGTLLPGHGGMLDRLDSFLFVAPAYVALGSWYI